MKKFVKKFVKLCLHSSYKVQNSFHFDEIFHRKFENSEFCLQKIREKNSRIFVYIQAIHAEFLTDNMNTPNFVSEKNCEKKLKNSEMLKKLVKVCLHSS